MVVGATGEAGLRGPLRLAAPAVALLLLVSWFAGRAGLGGGAANAPAETPQGTPPASIVFS
jgi:hypothetical protein